MTVSLKIVDILIFIESKVRFLTCFKNNLYLIILRNIILISFKNVKIVKTTAHYRKLRK